MSISTTINNLEILIRCDGSPQLGLGHVVRCLALACELRDSYGMHSGFAMMDKGVAEALVEQEKFPVFIKPDNIEEASWIDSLVKQHAPKGLILDIRTQLATSALQCWRTSGITVAVIDDPSDRRQAADLAFYPPVPQVTKADWSQFTGQAYIGWDYLLLRREFSIKRESPLNPTPSILVTMGGSDPGGLTLLALKALCQIKPPFYARVVLGRAFLHDQALEQLRPTLPDHFEFLRDVADMPSLMAGTDLAIASFGSTAYELAAIGVPALHLCLTEDHAISASAFDSIGIAVNLGVYSEISMRDLTMKIQTLLHDPKKRLAMATKSRETVDGQGTQRIARILATRVIGEKG